jgi:hypothetical protein
MTRAWIEDGKIMCCSDICEGIGCPQANFSPKCKEIKSPLKLKAERDRLKEALKNMIKISCLVCPDDVDIIDVLKCDTCTQCCNYHYTKLIEEVEAE